MQSPGYIPTLNGWRAVAISLVIGSHAIPVLEAQHNRVCSLLAHFFSHASYGVDIFFSLSGYLICTLLLREKDRMDGRISLKRFYLRRVFRIMPPLLAFLVAVAALSAAGLLPQVTQREVVASLCFFRNYVSGSWYTGHFWSLAIEEHFYMIIPFLLAAFRWRTALLIAVGLSAASASWRAIISNYAWFATNYPWLTSSTPMFRTENRFDGLMNGTILAILLSRVGIRDWFSRHLTFRVTIVLGVLTVVSLLAFPSQPMRRSIVALTLPLFIGFTVLHAESLPGRFLELAWLRWLGVLSYSFYLWQQLFLPMTTQPAAAPLVHLQSSFWSIGIALLVASLSYYCLEMPMIRVGHRLAGSPKSPAVVAPKTSAIVA